MSVALIFGGAGFIGTHLAKSLVARGGYKDIVCVDHNCDVRRPIPRNIADGVTEIYNLAAVHTTPGHLPHEYYDTNVHGAINITDFAAAIGASYILFTSSISVYGPTETVKHEESALEPVSDYGRSKIMAEAIHQSWQKAHGDRRLVIVRPAVIYGPG